MSANPSDLRDNHGYQICRWGLSRFVSAHLDDGAQIWERCYL